MDSDKKFNDLLKYVESIKNQMHALEDQIGNRSAEIFGLRMITRALLVTHRARADFEHSLRVLHESWLASAIQSEWSDTQIALVSKMALGATKHET